MDPVKRRERCHGCGGVYALRPLRRGESLRCGRCGTILASFRSPMGSQASCAVALTGLVLLGLANAQPIMRFSVAGNTQSNEIITGILVLFSQGYWPVAVLVLFCALIAPFLHFLSAAYASAACALPHPLPGGHLAARLASRSQPWSLLPVFALACIVSAVKLKMIGQVEWEAGIVYIGLLAVCSLVLSRLFSPREAVRKLSERRGAEGSAA